MSEAIAELRRLEESLWRPETRFDAEYLEEVLAPGFVEFGMSGEAYDRLAIMASPAHEINATLPLPDFAVRSVTSEVAIVTYRSEVRENDRWARANRCSIWRGCDGRWLLEFHQGTPVAG